MVDQKPRSRYWWNTCTYFAIPGIVIAPASTGRNHLGIGMYDRQIADVEQNSCPKKAFRGCAGGAAVSEYWMAAKATSGATSNANSCSDSLMVTRLSREMMEIEMSTPKKVRALCFQLALGGMSEPPPWVFFVQRIAFSFRSATV